MSSRLGGIDGPALPRTVPRTATPHAPFPARLGWVEPTKVENYLDMWPMGKDHTREVGEMWARTRPS